MNTESLQKDMIAYGKALEQLGDSVIETNWNRDIAEVAETYYDISNKIHQWAWALKSKGETK